MNREDFPMLQNDIIYFDNSATSLKPKCMIDALTDYYENYSANAHRGDYDISFKVDTKYEEARKIVAEFINAEPDEIAFTAGTTDSLNTICFGYFGHHFDDSYDVVLTKTEHASNVLPWFVLHQEKNVNIKWIDLTDDYSVLLENVKKAVTNKTRVISLAYVTNTIGDVRPLKEIIKFAHENNIIVVVDAAQAAPHMKIDVKDLDCDFLAFSAHKCYGPTGLGVLYGRKDILRNLMAVRFGGGMNEAFDSEEEIALKPLPYTLEAGTQAISQVISFAESIKYIEKIGMEKIHEHEVNLKKLLVSKLKDMPHIRLYNPDTKSGLITFNVEGVFPQDVAYYLNKYHVCVRAGNHCAKLTKFVLDNANTVRISLAFYNTEEEVLKVADLLKDKDRIIKEMI